MTALNVVILVINIAVIIFSCLTVRYMNQTRRNLKRLLREQQELNAMLDQMHDHTRTHNAKDRP